jgi:hypothetical protein
MDKDGDEPAPPKGDADPKGIPPVGEPYLRKNSLPMVISIWWLSHWQVLDQEN